MSRKRRWDPCVEHRGAEIEPFVNEYFGQRDRRALLIAGAGFDPRSTVVCEKLVAVMGSRIAGLFLKEERPNPSADLQDRATQNLDRMTGLLSRSQTFKLDIFDKDNAFVGGRNVVNTIHQQSLEGFTDFIIDSSALSIGVSYPTTRYLVEKIGRQGGRVNLHLFVASDAVLDESIIPLGSDIVGCIHGFKGGWALDDNANAAKLWMPQLARGRRPTLQRIYNFVDPHDVCPVLPFPSSRPRLGDELAEHFLTELESGWNVDPRNIVYAAEDDPLDLYRTILRIDDLRKPVFEGVGGSLLVLSPVGSKVLALGALMAALERDLPVVYLEAIGYEMNVTQQDGLSRATSNLIHVWLEGEVYSRGVTDEDASTKAMHTATNQ